MPATRQAGVPLTHIADAGQLSHLAEGHHLAPSHDQGHPQLGETAARVSLGHRDLGPFGAGTNQRTRGTLT